MYLREELEAARAVLVSRKEEALAAAAAELSKAAVLNMFLAGSLAHEFLAHGTVLGGAADRGSAELSCMLVANGAHLPGLVNPTQILSAVGSGAAVDPTQLLASAAAQLPGVGVVDQTKGDDHPIPIAADPEDFQQLSTGDERYETYRSLLACRMDEGSSVSQHVLRLSGYMQRLEALGCPVSQELGAGLILASLPPPPLLQRQATSEIHEIYRDLFACKMAEDGSVNQHVLRLSGYMQRLDTLKCPVSQELGTQLVLASLPPSYSSFATNYSVGSKSIGELFAMLKTTADRSGVQNHKEVHCVMAVNKNADFKKKAECAAESGVHKEWQGQHKAADQSGVQKEEVNRVMTVNENTDFKKKKAKFSAESGVQKEVNRAMTVSKTIDFKKKKANKSKKKGKSKGADGVTTPVKPQTGPHPDAECFFCKQMGHWKRNCNKFLAEKKLRNSISGTMEA